MPAVLQGVNQWIMLAFYHAAASFSIFSATFVFFAEWFPYLVIASVLVYEFYIQDSIRKTLRALSITLFAPILAWIIVAMMKSSLPSPRPFVSDLGITPFIAVSDAFGSFPSAHAAVFGALAGVMVARRSGAWKWYVVAALVIAISRIAVGVHFPIDIVVGLCLGFSIGVLIETFFHTVTSISHPKSRN
jgi:membrane-associated phospholipid phosphatase